MQPKHKLTWRSPEEIVEIAFQRASVVMMNEAHSGLQRCIRTRQIGKRILPVAHQAGVRHLAMEALNPTFAEQGNQSRVVPDYEAGYLSQPEMRSFIQAALDFGWTLVPYEASPFPWLSSKYGINFPNITDMHEFSTHLQPYQADLISQDFTNWREEQQARNLIAALQSMSADTPLLVWCGNGHNSKRVLESWKPMGYCFQQLSGMNPFAIDQIRSVNFESQDNGFSQRRDSIETITLSHARSRCFLAFYSKRIGVIFKETFSHERLFMYCFVFYSSSKKTFRHCEEGDFPDEAILLVICR